MDISSYIGELLFGHDCVIIPGFGGFICNYKPADIHPVLNTISPPSKAISFNKNLQSNDGLLVNHIAHTLGLSFNGAFDLVNNWVNSSKNLLKKGEAVELKKIGTFSNDVEGNLQFAPKDEVNYLKTSFGLKTITVEPIIRERQIEFTEKFIQETKHPVSTRKVWSIAASILLIVALVGLGELMWMGVEIKPLQLNESGTFGFINQLFRTPEPEIKPIPVEIKNTTLAVDSSLLTDNRENAVNQEPSIDEKTTDKGVKEDNYAPSTPASNSPTYYIIIGAFAEEGNIEASKQLLQQKFPDSTIYIEKGKKITKLGYSVGNNFSKAKEQLSAAQEENTSYWLLKK